jgi:hypothetical protein
LSEQRAAEQELGSRMKWIMSKRVGINCLVFCILALALWIIYLSVSAFSTNSTSLEKCDAVWFLSLKAMILMIYDRFCDHGACLNLFIIFCESAIKLYKHHLFSLLK